MDEPKPANGRRLGLTEADKAEMIRLYTDEHRSTLDIARRFNCCDATAAYWLRKLNVKMRPRNGARSRGFVLPKPRGKHAAKAARNGALSQAVMQSKQFYQPSLISFPESPRLEMAWRHELAKVRAERGCSYE